MRLLHDIESFYISHLLYSKHVHSTTYYHLNLNVPILQLYSDNVSNLRPDLRLTRDSIAALSGALTHEADREWREKRALFLYFPMQLLTGYSQGLLTSPRLQSIG